jgi:hypothetical protein
VAKKLLRWAVLIALAFAVVFVALEVYRAVDPEHFPLAGLHD